MPAPITATLPSRSRTGSQVLGPTTMPSGYTQAVCALNIATASYEDLATRIDVLFEYNDPTDGWLPMGEIAFSGGRAVGRTGGVNPAPTITIPIQDKMAGLEVRVTIVTDTTATFGATLTLS